MKLDEEPDKLDEEFDKIDNLVMQYRNLEVEKDIRILAKEDDFLLKEWSFKLKKLRDAADKLTFNIDARFRTFGIAEIEAKQNELKELMKFAWEDQEKKTHKSSIGTITLKTTKSLIVDSAKSVVEFLLKNDKCKEGVSKFNLPELRKFADAGLLNKGATHYDERKTISIKLKEDK